METVIVMDAKGSLPGPLFPLIESNGVKYVALRKGHEKRKKSCEFDFLFNHNKPCSYRIGTKSRFSRR